jgi:hypothetical protein
MSLASRSCTVFLCGSTLSSVPRWGYFTARRKTLGGWGVAGEQKVADKVSSADKWLTYRQAHFENALATLFIYDGDLQKVCLYSHNTTWSALPL